MGRAALIAIVAGVLALGCHRTEGNFEVRLENDADAAVVATHCANWGRDDHCAKRHSQGPDRLDDGEFEHFAGVAGGPSHDVRRRHGVVTATTA
jgi:hypothetical protein